MENSDEQLPGFWEQVKIIFKHGVLNWKLDKEYLRLYYETFSTAQKLAFDKCYRYDRYKTIIAYNEKDKQMDQKLLNSMYKFTSEPNKETELELNLLKKMNTALNIQKINYVYLMFLLFIPVRMKAIGQISSKALGWFIVPGLGITILGTYYKTGPVNELEKLIITKNIAQAHQYKKNVPKKSLF